METTPLERLSDGYADSARAARIPNRKRERDALAANFKLVPSLETMSALRELDSEAFRQLHIGVRRIELAAYEKARDAFYRTGEFSDEAIAPGS
jgi:hypothetical protein